jgi:hypothetical protein
MPKKKTTPKMVKIKESDLNYLKYWAEEGFKTQLAVPMMKPYSIVLEANINRIKKIGK